ncbi:MFS transporter [Caviibacter abscessus]|uniref:MFS transporter n=1 Tax=Caviibacter abscessus TaxID=1766719 RepID=UPI00082C2147|nr:MFS transporter [Caviibacter abscessus]
MGNKLRKNINLFFISTVQTTIARSLPHSVLTIFLLKKGISLSNIILIQSAFSLSILMFEFPSGLWSDLYDRKTVFLCSNVFLAISFFSIYYFNNVYMLYLSWFIYGFSEALNSGTLDADIINDIKNVEDNNYLNNFFKKSNQVYFLSLIIGSTLGSFLYFRIGKNIYLISVLLILTSFMIIYFLFESNYKRSENMKKQSVYLHIKTSLMELRSSKILKYSLLRFCVFQIFFQTHFQLWQALLINKNIDARFFFIFYLVFQVIGIVSSYTPIVEIKGIKKYFKYVVVVVLMMFGLISMLIVQNKVIFIAIYTILVFVFTSISYYFNTIFSKELSKENISSLISLKSTLARIVSVMILFTVSFLLKVFDINKVVMFNFSIVIILAILMIYKFFKIKTEKDLFLS